jgi:hypothetical protein
MLALAKALMDAVSKPGSSTKLPTDPSSDPPPSDHTKDGAGEFPFLSSALGC